MLSVRFSAINARYEGYEALVFPSVLFRSPLGEIFRIGCKVYNWFRQKITHLEMKSRKCRKEMWSCVFPLNMEKGFARTYIYLQYFGICLLKFHWHDFPCSLITLTCLHSLSGCEPLLVISAPWHWFFCVSALALLFNAAIFSPLPPFLCLSLLPSLFLSLYLVTS